jgi:GxxExxY protein
MTNKSLSAALKHGEVTDKILRVFFKVVYAQLGYGFLEKVYENALIIALAEAGLEVESQVKIPVYFQGNLIGEYFADLVVDGKVIIEIKAARQIQKEHEAQLLNYLRATPYEVGLLLNFRHIADFRRAVYDNTKKPTITWEKR